jgi:hypothetical protein
VESRQPQVSLFGWKRSLQTQESNPTQADQIERALGEVEGERSRLFARAAHAQPEATARLSERFSCLQQQHLWNNGGEESDSPYLTIRISRPPERLLGIAAM